MAIIHALSFHAKIFIIVMSRGAILMYAKLVTHNKGEEGYNECKVMRACLRPALMRGWLKLTPN